ncbi:MAG: FHA domain-containing protein [Prevotellaceae bacterium]|jgi:pSer/pThr/pTyr-binding forkhead associated (FHA) protein|nr:FHA domain-containing protein [Prevotellaceae bacterium]
MTKNEILIGRQVSDGNYPVENKYSSVGRVHAKISREPDGLYIEDFDSINGTFVNGIRIKTKKISLTDKVSLGGADYFQLNLNEIIKLLPLSDNEFCQRILELRQIYDSYQTVSNELQTKGQEGMMTKRMMPTMLLGVLTTLVTMLAGNDPQIKIAIALSGGFLTVLVFIAATKWASKSSKAMKEKLNRLNERFELDYVCPSCGASFRGRSWEFLKRMGKCPACQREFRLNK